jgi:hypothetical protein
MTNEARKMVARHISKSSIILVALFTLATDANAQNFDVESIENAGVIVFTEEVSLPYVNYWLYQDVSIGGNRNRALLFGEGKTVNFEGMIEVSCSNRSHVWGMNRNLSLYGELDETVDKEALENIVPAKAVENAILVHCVMPVVESAFMKLDSENRKSVQRSLQYIGLYNSTIDGLWGRGSFNGLVEIAAYFEKIGELKVENEQDALTLFSYIGEMEEYEGYYSDG